MLKYGFFNKYGLFVHKKRTCAATGRKQDSLSGKASKSGNVVQYILDILLGTIHYSFHHSQTCMNLYAEDSAAETGNAKCRCGMAGAGRQCEKSDIKA